MTSLNEDKRGENRLNDRVKGDGAREEGKVKRTDERYDS